MRWNAVHGRAHGSQNNVPTRVHRAGVGRARELGNHGHLRRVFGDRFHVLTLLVAFPPVGRVFFPAFGTYDLRDTEQGVVSSSNTVS